MGTRRQNAHQILVSYEKALKSFNRRYGRFSEKLDETEMIHSSNPESALILFLKNLSSCTISIHKTVYLFAKSKKQKSDNENKT